MYDIQYLKQRKLLLLFLTDLLEENRRRYSNQTGEIRRIVTIQNDLLGKLYGRLRKGLGIEKESFEELAEMERRLTEVWRIS